MKLIMWAKEGQTHCYDCGKKFVPAYIPTDKRPVAPTVCPTEGCNRGSWIQLNYDKEYCVPFEVRRAG